MLAPGNAVLASETPSGAGLKVLHLVSRPIKQEKMAPPDQEPEHVCTICGEKSAHKAAFNAHIRAHLKEKLSSKLERRGEQVGQVGQVGQVVQKPQYVLLYLVVLQYYSMLIQKSFAEEKKLASRKA